MNLDTVGPWHLKYVEECFPNSAQQPSRSHFRLQLNKWIKSSRKSSKPDSVLVAIIGNHGDVFEGNDSYGVEEECSYWLAEVKTLVSKEKKKVDPGQNPGDVIAKGNYFLSVQYFSLVALSSFKYQISDMLISVVDFSNVVTTTRIYWNKVYRADANGKRTFQLDNRTHGVIVHQVKHYVRL